MSEIICDGFDFEMVPIKASEENKTGITIKGKDVAYIEAHRILKDFFRTRGQKFYINGIELRIVDLPRNKLIKIEVKPKMGLSGKVNLNIFDINAKGGATMMIQKVSGGDFSHVKIFGLKVMKFLIDGIIDGSIEEQHIESYKVKTEQRADVKEVMDCKKCEKTFKKEQGLKLHVARMHKEDEKNECDSCESSFESSEQLKEHVQNKHEDIASPNAKKQKQSIEEMDTFDDHSSEFESKWRDLETNSWEEIRCNHRNIEIEINEDELDKMEEYNEKERKCKFEKKLKDVEEKKMEDLNDEKVLKKQKEWIEEEVRYQEMKKKYSEEKEKEDTNRKRQLSVGKKKKSKSKKKKKGVENEINKEEKKDCENVKDIPDKFDPLFKAVGKNRKDYKIYKVKADGACAANCVALHVHGEAKLGTYVRRNMNTYEAEFFPFFRPFYIWPHTEMVGLKLTTFQNEREYTEFLRNNPESGKLWMDHQGLQIVANAYQMKIHILTIGIESMEEPKARWTHLVPDERLERFNNKLVDDLWMIHEDGVHFDLIIKKESVLASNELIGDMSEGKIVDEIVLKDQETGPGYMGWKIPDFGTKIEESKEITKNEGEHDRLKDIERKIEVLEKGNNENKKEMNELRKELKNTKEEYAKCMEALMKETYERNKAEILCKVLKDKLDTEKEIEETSKSIAQEERQENSEEDMHIDEEEHWTEQRNNKRKRKELKIKIINCKCDLCNEEVCSEQLLKEHKSKKHAGKNEKGCVLCNMTFVTQSDLNKHCATNHASDISHSCEQCDSSYETFEELSEHMEIDHGNDFRFSCPACKSKFKTKNELKKHVRNNHESDINHSCEKCDSSYETLIEFNEHMEIAHGNEFNLNCKECKSKFKTKNELNNHLRNNHKMDKPCKGEECNSKSKMTKESSEHIKKIHSHSRFPCQKCDRMYPTMSDLRRHDWRSHREIQCNRCGETISSREELKDHREKDHKMGKKIYCRYFPNCMDGTECLYEHEMAEEKNGHGLCVNGLECRDQSCRYSDKEHRQGKELCKFQINCNRLNCNYRHMVARRAFLEMEASKESKK